ncbi:prolyl oligopeptidase family serine peptidase [Lacunimicrobium album]
MRLAAVCFRAFALTLALFAILLIQNADAQESAVKPATGITLDRIMSDPEWISRSPQRGYWADDSQSIYYQRKRAGSELSDWFQSDLAGNILRVVEDKDLGTMDTPGGILSADGKRKAYDRAGDLFLKNLETGEIQQLTRTRHRESSPKFMTDGKRLMFQRDDVILARDLKTGLEAELVDLRMENDPDEKRKKDREGYLKEQQTRLFDVLRKQRDDQDAAREESQIEQAADPTRTPLPWYLGDARRLERAEVSPDDRWCVVILASKSTDRGTTDKMPQFVDESGYVNVRNVRSLVGTDKPESDQLYLLDLMTREKFELKFETLPDFNVDRLEEIRNAGKKWLAAQRPQKEAEPKVEEKPKEEPKTEDSSKAEPAKDSTPDGEKKDGDTKPKKDTSKFRTLQVGGIQWNEPGTRVVVQVYSDDNKDRWIASIDLEAKQLKNLHHSYDEAWVSRGGGVDWLNDNESIAYTSEETGYAMLDVTNVATGETKQLTTGKFVVSDLQLGETGKFIYYQANVDHPGIYEAYRVEIGTGKIEQLTKLGGMNDFLVSPDESKLLVTHSTALMPPELVIQNIGESKESKQITQTVAPEFLQLPWIKPQFVTVPSVTGQQIYARLYLPPGESAQALAKNSKRPAVLFIHGAGYLQNAHQGWSQYFREFMFHSLLAYKGYVVLDMDYRASAGYGRDWRTAIYRHMGEPEVQDLLDGRDWLAKNHQVDAKRVGLYGGSYGGFLTMMALFKKPGEFACGAALRPVTDWAHYNHGYTASILNTPETDPEAYFRSSPIEFASGLADPLLICHGMVDDNVFFKDTARLAQRLIELKKDNWEVALYPVEPHGFVQPTSWYDEYRRILKLFETELN